MGRGEAIHMEPTMLGMVLLAAAYGALAAALGVAGASDLARRVVPNGCVLAVAASGVLRALARGLLAGQATGLALRGLIGGAVVLGVLLLAAGASVRLRGEPGIGGGDVKLLAAAGLWTGPAGGLAVVALSCLLGVLGWAAARVLCALRGRAPGAAGIPLAPAIAVALLAVVLLAGEAPVSL